MGQLAKYFEFRHDFPDVGRRDALGSNDKSAVGILYYSALLKPNLANCEWAFCILLQS